MQTRVRQIPVSGVREAGELSVIVTRTMRPMLFIGKRLAQAR